MDKNDLRSITKFIPALSSGELGEWVAGEVTEENIASVPAPWVEYWDVVHRFAEAVLDLRDKAEANPEATEEYAVEKAAIDALVGMIGAEEECPGVLLGYIKNGTVLRLLERLASMLG